MHQPIVGQLLINTKKLQNPDVLILIYEECVDHANYFIAYCSR